MMKFPFASSPLRAFALSLSIALILMACNGQRGQRLEDLPTPASVDTLATDVFMTQNAPPEGYRGEVSFPQIDVDLNNLAGWRYIVQLEFNGVFARTPRETSANATAEVWFAQLGSARRVVVNTSGELIGRQENDDFEAVRLGPSAFLVRDNTCVVDIPDARTAADLRAGALVGGVAHAVPTGHSATVNGQEAWQYSFETVDLNLPAIRFSDNGYVEATGGELWVAPAVDAVVRFYVNLNVDNAIIFDRQLPVSGQVILRYDLYDIGTPANITTPFGC